VPRSAARSSGGHLDPVLSRRYARSLFNVAAKRQIIDAVAADLQAIAELLKAEPRFQSFMLAPDVVEEQRSGVLDRVLQKVRPEISPLTRNFLNLLLKKARFDHFEEIAESFSTLVEEHRGILRALVTTATAIDPEVQARLRSRLERMTGKSIQITHRLDPEILGGVVVTLAGRMIDGSVKSEVERLRDELMATRVI
jgi:F-type H+-transporting ATPase subunit delta